MRFIACLLRHFCSCFNILISTPVLKSLVSRASPSAAVVLFATAAIAQTNTFPATGNVGIGTSTPVSPLDVRSASRIATLYSTNNANSSVEIGNSVTHMDLGVGAIAPTAGVPYLWSANSNFMIGNDGNPTLFINGMANGNVGIGTTAPAYLLDVAGQVRASGGVIFADGTMQSTAYNGGNSSASPGVTSGIVSFNGASSPLVAWDAITAQVTNPSTANGTIYNGYSSTPAITATDGTSRTVIGGAFSPSLVATGGSSSSIFGVNSGATIGSPSATGGYNDLFGGAFSATTAPTAPRATTVTNLAAIKASVGIDSGSVTFAHGIFVQASFGSTSGPANLIIPTYYGLELMPSTYANGATVTNNIGISQEDPAAKNFFAGNVGIGTIDPGAALEVSGTGIKLTRGSGGSITFQDGTTQSTAFIPANCGADYAEAVDVTGERTNYEPGDVLVIDPNAPGKFLKANQAYSGLVAGIYSTQPGFVGRLHPATPSSSATEVPMAMVGRVPTKVSAENGSIKVGDLLVSSSTPGYAMKGTDRSQMLGAVIGKALGSLDSGTGVIEVLVALQ